MFGVGLLHPNIVDQERAGQVVFDFDQRFGQEFGERVDERIHVDYPSTQFVDCQAGGRCGELAGAPRHAPRG